MWSSKQNCYAYAFNDSRERSEWFHVQPGNDSGVLKRGMGDDYTCPVVHRRVMADNGHDTYPVACKGAKCPKGFRKIAMGVDKDQDDYHFWRRDGHRRWSHKRGSGRIYKFKGHPLEYDWNYGKYHYNICGCYCTRKDNRVGR